jgi:hypothetical protein
MTPRSQRAESLPPAIEEAEPLELTVDQIAVAEPAVEPPFDADQWTEKKSAGSRQVLGIGLAVIAVLWLAYTAWSAGRSLAGQPLSSPLIAQWLSVAAGPLALLGIAWLTFGRTRRKETERFTHSVVVMRHEAQSLEALLEVLSQRINDSRTELVTISRNLMQLGDEATGKFGGIAREFDSSAQLLRSHGEALDRAAESARTDIGVLLADLPQAEQTARSLSEQLRSAGVESVERTAQLAQQVGDLSQRTREADYLISQAVDGLSARMTEIELAAGSAATRIGEADSNLSELIDALLARTSATLEEIRSGIDAQSAAVAALVSQAQAGIGRAGADAAESLASNIGHASSTLEALSSRVAEQERASQHMIAEIDRGLGLIDERFAQLAANGDERANHFLETLTRARMELDALASQAVSQDDALGSLAERTESIRAAIDRLTIEIREGAAIAIGEAQWGAERLAQSADALKPELNSIRNAVLEAADKLSLTGGNVEDQKERFAALLSIIDNGVEGARVKLGDLSATIAQAEQDAANLSAQTGPALVEALVQVREAAGHAALRAREAIEAVIPEAAGKLSDETRKALERVIRESVEDRLREVETVAARAVDSARGASDRLTQQMMTLGHAASALEAHIEQTDREQREKDSEAFARRVSLLMDSMHSAAIDVGKILADEIDDRAWERYLKGNRGVFTSRAARLMDGSETKAIRAHYETDLEFQRSSNRYVADFEAMLRRVLAERDGGMIAVTLLSSDMGKLYAALSQAIEKRR